MSIAENFCIDFGVSNAAEAACTTATFVFRGLLMLSGGVCDQTKYGGGGLEDNTGNRREDNGHRDLSEM